MCVPRTLPHATLQSFSARGRALVLIKLDGRAGESREHHCPFDEGGKHPARSLREDDGDDHAIETEGLTEDENKDHADEDFLLLSVCADTSVTNNTNSETSCEGRKTASQTGGQVLVAISISVSRLIWGHYIIILSYLDKSLFNKAVRAHFKFPFTIS